MKECSIILNHFKLDKYFLQDNEEREINLHLIHITDQIL